MYLPSAFKETISRQIGDCVKQQLHIEKYVYFINKNTLCHWARFNISLCQHKSLFGIKKLLLGFSKEEHCQFYDWILTLNV